MGGQDPTLPWKLNPLSPNQLHHPMRKQPHRCACCHQLGGLETLAGHVIALSHDLGALLVQEHEIMNLLAGSKEGERKRMNELGKRE